ncbi:uncharacterized protein LOC126790285 isoform X1 [Argentina anserina]|uniref:uncharacterized protein LOC126790285 isoform X1 n=1 Tax=Argentina anserina TaxID=57926 RepID=UPI00217690C8|nr:uncharacterized protein LOC126790285 isoform X1 [Potentilla anserina]XP_050372423.1 uncharacterized protein LOC126790285 isoform X1 [Potentilla anserina]XP_050372424.1 uncharacterized protein LOC126790285 isoform X1 [Potentilla anserina]
MNNFIKLCSLNAVRSLRHSQSPAATLRTMTTCNSLLRSHSIAPTPPFFYEYLRHLPEYSYPKFDLPKNWGHLTVPEDKAYVIERFREYHRALHAGSHFLIPLVDKVAFIYSLKEEVFHLPEFIHFIVDGQRVYANGVIHLTIVEPLYVSRRCGGRPFKRVLSYAHTIMCSEIIDSSLECIEKLEQHIQKNITSVVSEFGVECTQCRIRVKAEEFYQAKEEIRDPEIFTKVWPEELNEEAFNNLKKFINLDA